MRETRPRYGCNVHKIPHQPDAALHDQRELGPGRNPRLNALADAAQPGIVVRAATAVRTGLPCDCWRAEGYSRLSPQQRRCTGDAATRIPGPKAGTKSRLPSGQREDGQPPVVECSFVGAGSNHHDGEPWGRRPAAVGKRIND